MRLLFFFLFSFCFFTGIAQTKLTLLLDRNGNKIPIDSIRFTRFSKDEKIVVPLQDNISVSFEEQYADLCSADYFANEKVIYTWQSWIDTGAVTVKTKLKPLAKTGTSLVIDTVISSPITYTAKRFYAQLGTYRHRTDTATLNELLIKSYTENAGNPFSFVIGRIYYDYNQNSIQQYPAINALEREQGKEIKKSIFYSMMLRERFRNSEKLFINYFSKPVLLNTAGGQTGGPLNRSKYNIIFFAGPATQQALEEFNNLSNKWKSFAPADFNFFVVYSQDKQTWKPILEKSTLPFFQLINEQQFEKETLCYPDTKFYIVDGLLKIPGVFDSFDQLSAYFSKL